MLIKINAPFWYHPEQYDPQEEKQLDFQNIRCLESKLQLVFKHRQSQKILFKEISYEPQKLVFISEVVHSKLFQVSFSSTFDVLGLQIYINDQYIDEYINKSSALSIYIANEFRKQVVYKIKSELGSFIPNFVNEEEEENNNLQMMLNNQHVNWFPYQKNTIKHLFHFEKNNDIPQIINITLDFKFGTKTIKYEPIYGQMSNSEDFHLEMVSKGYIIADEMGLGKTLTALSLLDSRIEKEEKIIPEITTNSTLIVVPSHLASQWQNEIDKLYQNNKKKKIIKLFTKTQHMNVSYSDIVSSDVILTTQQFLLNLKYYTNLVYSQNGKESPTLTKLNSKYYIKYHTNLIRMQLDRYKNGEMNWMDNQKAPYLEHFAFRRILLDEAHEIYSMSHGTISQSKFFQRWINSIVTEHKYFISGTPIINHESIFNIIKFLDIRFRLQNKNNQIVELNSNIEHLLTKEYIMSQILSKLLIRTRKEDVMNQIEIPSKKEEILWIELTPLERNLYDSKSRYWNSFQNTDMRRINNLQQLCCHILVSSSHKKNFTSLKDIDLFEMKDQLIRFHIDNIQKYTKKKESLLSNNSSYYMLKKMCETKISESTYMLNILQKLSQSESDSESQSSTKQTLDDCCICIDQPVDPVMLKCGHYFCSECFKHYMNVNTNQKKCPTCKNKINSNDEIFHVFPKQKNQNQNQSNIDNTQYIIEKYGSKLGNVICLVKSLLSQNVNNKIIVFSQFDVMLRLIQNCLAENKISSSTVKGNVYHRQHQIDQFQGKKENQDTNDVLLLSLRMTASGTNLIEANHIIFIEPVYAPSQKEIESIEMQAIGRSHRIGQDKELTVHKFYTKNTIEEEIYNHKLH